MNKRELERKNATLRAENARLRQILKDMNRLSAEQFKRLQAAETNAQRYREWLAEVYDDESAA